MITSTKPEGFPIDIIPCKSQRIPGTYAVAFMSDCAFAVHYTVEGEHLEKLFADTPLAPDLELYGVVEALPNQTSVTIVPVEDAIKKATRKVLEFCLEEGAKYRAEREGKVQG